MCPFLDPNILTKPQYSLWPSDCILNAYPNILDVFKLWTTTVMCALIVTLVVTGDNHSLVYHKPVN